MDDSEVYDPGDLSWLPRHGGPSSDSSPESELRFSDCSDGSRVGMSFSGGGMRSAAFCSGVLRKMVEDDVDISHMSCVSGGGYIGCSFVDWVANVRVAESKRGECSDIRQIADGYFRHLTQNYAIYCDWGTAKSGFRWRGLLDTLLFVAAVLVIFCLLPLLALMSFIPVAIRIETTCGNVMRSAIASPSTSTCADDESAGQFDCMDSASPLLIVSLVTATLGGCIMSFSHYLKAPRPFCFAAGMWLGLQLALVGALVLVASLLEIMSRKAASVAADNVDVDHSVAVYGAAALVIVYLLLWLTLPGSPMRLRVGHALMLLVGAKFLQWIVFTVPDDKTGESRLLYEKLIWLTSLILLSMFILGPLRFTLPFLYNRWCLGQLLYENRDKAEWRPSCFSMPLSVNMDVPQQAITPPVAALIRRALRNSLSEKVYSFPSGWMKRRRSSSCNANDVVVAQPTMANGKGVSAPRQSEPQRHSTASDGVDQTDGGAWQPGRVHARRRSVRLAERHGDAHGQDWQPPGNGFDAHAFAANSAHSQPLSVRLEVPPSSAGGVDETDMAMRSDGIDFELDGGLTLNDIDQACEGIELLSQMVVGKWRLSDQDESNSQLLVLSSRQTDVLSKAENGDTPRGIHVRSEDVRTLDAMAMSGAALSLHNGMYSGTFAAMAFSGLQLMLGVAMGSSMMNTMTPGKAPKKMMILGLTVAIYTVLAACVFCQGMDIGGLWPLAVEWTLSSFITMSALLPMYADDRQCGQGSSNRFIFNLRRLARWINLYVHSAFLVREFLDIDSVGLEAPAVIYLSDGGHLENLGLLPLLHRQCKKIVIADGGAYGNPKNVANDLLLAMEQARKWLGCSFTAVDGGDINFDLQRKLIDPGRRGEPQPQTYRFRVVYHTDGDGQPLAQPVVGELILVQPRHPDLRSTCGGSGVLPGDVTRSEQAKDADNLTGCCCACCHGHCHGLSYCLCGKFPSISTAAQGFTKQMFDMFHNEGRRAASALQAEEFWSAH